MIWIKRTLVFFFATIGVLVVVGALMIFFASWFGSPAHKVVSIPVLQLVGKVQVENKPAAACQVYVRSPWPIMREEASGQTDQQGQYDLELNSVRDDGERYSLWARMPFSPDTDLMASASLANRGLQPAAGGARQMHCDLTIPYRPGTLDLLVVVQDRNGLPYPGEEIQLHRANRSYYLVKKLDAQGATTFTQLQPGSYHLQCLVPSRERPAKDHGPRRAVETVFASADAKLDASLTEAITLVPAGKGKVRIAGAVTLNGVPLPNLPIELSYRHGGYWEYHVPHFSMTNSDCKLQAVTDQSGKYAFANLPAVPAKLKWTLTTADREWEIDKDIQTAVANQDFAIVATASIKGKVAPVGSGADLPAVELVARHYGSRSTNGVNRFSATTMTDKQGEFLFENLPEGEYVIQQSMPVRGSRPELVLKPAEIRLKAGEELGVMMERE